MAMRSGALEEVINLYKFQGKQQPWARIFGRLLVAFLAREGLLGTFDLIVASPTYTGRGGRSFDHTSLVLREAAREAASQCGPSRLQFDPAAIIKRERTEALTGKNYQDRRTIAEQQLRNALYVPHPSRIRGRRILVFDDVFTTGLTLNEVARALRRGGATEVCCVTLARQPW